MKNFFKKLVFALSAFLVFSVIENNIVLAQGETYGSVTDADGNIYRTLKIGNQTWMLENLKTTKYNDGTPIASLAEIGDLRKSISPAYSLHQNNKEQYGNLYNWYAVNTNKLAPKGWHVPSKQDWEILLNYLGGFSKAGDKMKSTSWSSNGSSGFNALPAGFIGNTGMFMNVGNAAFWWSAHERNATQADYVKTMSSLPSALSNAAVKQFYMSVRCIKN